jgi:hypothetical protein
VQKNNMGYFNHSCADNFLPSVLEIVNYNKLSYYDIGVVKITYSILLKMQTMIVLISVECKNLTKVLFEDA